MNRLDETAVSEVAGEHQPTDGVAFLVLLAENLRSLVLLPVAVGLVALGISYMMTPVFTARVVILPPQQQQSAAALALQNLGPLAALSGAAGGARSTVDQFATLMQSASVEDQVIDRFKLVDVYGVRLRADARRELEVNTRVLVSKKDGLITLEFDDADPKRAANIANAYVQELEQLTKRLAVTEAQQRRVFFEAQLVQTKQRFAAAQADLEGAGINEGAMRAEPRAAADSYAKLRAELAAAEVRIQALRSFLADAAPEIQIAESRVSALRMQLTRTESVSRTAASGSYINKYREFKYQETLYDLFVRQLELAKLDEAREGAAMQVVDVATQPERKSKPKRALIAIVATLATAMLMLIWLALGQAWTGATAGPDGAAMKERLASALRRAIGRKG